MEKAHFVSPPSVISKATIGQRIIVSADIENIGDTSDYAFYMTVWDSEGDYIMSRAEAFVEPGKITKFNCFFNMPNKDLWIDIIAGHYKSELPGWQDDEVYGAKIEKISKLPLITLFMFIPFSFFIPGIWKHLKKAKSL